MLNIRLARTGRKRDAHFRVVVSDSVHGRVGRIVETLGYYHPRMPNDAEGRLQIDAERARYWLGNGAQPSLTVKSFLKRGMLASSPAGEAPAEDTPAADTPAADTAAAAPPAPEAPPEAVAAVGEDEAGAPGSAEGEGSDA